MKRNYFVKLYLIVIMAGLFLSCEKSVETAFVDTSIDFIVKDSEGNDLLNPKNPNSINIDNIKLLFDIDGEQVVYYDENMDAPKGIMHYEQDGLYYLRIVKINFKDKNESLPVMYIQWTENDTDKITCEVVKYDTGSMFTQKVWLNDELVWTLTPGGSKRMIELIK